MNPKLIHTYRFDLQSFKTDILISKDIMKPKLNQYDIIFKCDNFSNILKIVTDTISNETSEIFDVYVKKLQSYIQTQTNNSPIGFEMGLKRGIIPHAKYSFIFMVDSLNTTVYLKSKKIELSNGDLLIFKTDDFVKDESTSFNRLALIGSLTNEIQSSKIKKYNGVL